LKVAVILGTRPEIIKMSPIIRALEKRRIDYFVLHTGQHYDYEMDGAFFRDLKLPKPEFNLGVGSGSHAEQTSKIMVGVEKILANEEPDITLVEGDTNTVLGGALVAAKLHKKLGHIEAGLRSGDMRMPEEVNRIVADHVSDQLYAPTDISYNNLLREGISDSKVFVTGNTIVDAVRENLEYSKERFSVKDLGLSPGGYFLVTLHRAENVDSELILRGLLSSFRNLILKYGLPIVFPMHPRTTKKVEEFGLLCEGIDIIKPLGYLDFLQLESKARLILTDSGGVQEEACCLNIPCVTLRDSTERPETVNVGANLVVGRDLKGVLTGVEKMIGVANDWLNPYGNGASAVKIIEIMRNTYG